MEPYCERTTKKRTRPYWSRAWTSEKHVPPEANNSRWSRHCGHHQSSRFAKMQITFVDKEAILPHNHRLPAASGKIGVVGKIGLVQTRHQKDNNGRKKHVSKPSHRKTRALTLTCLKQRRATVIWTSSPLSQWRAVDKHLTARMFFSAFTHCVLSRLLVLAWALCVVQTSWRFASALWYLSGRWLGTVVRPYHWQSRGAPSTVCNGTRRPSSRSSQIRTQRTSHIFSWREKMYDAVVQHIAHRVVRQNIYICVSASLGRKWSIWLLCQRSTLFRILSVFGMR